MRFTLFSVLALEAARFSVAVNLQNQPEVDEQYLAQTNAFLDNDNLAEALSKVISSLNPSQASALAQLANQADPAAPAAPAAPAPAKTEPIVTPGPKTTTVPAPPGAGKEKGTNIAITTATDQHIQIWVPENPNAKVSVKKTEGVKIVESDSDKVDKNAEIKKAIGDKIRGELVKKALSTSAPKKKEEEDDKADKDDLQKKKDALAAVQNERKKIDKQITNLHSKAQTGVQAMTEDEIMALAELGTMEWTSEDEFAEMEVVDEEDDSFAETGGMLEDEILGLAQTESELTPPKPIVSLTPQVHVQVTRVGYD